MEIVEENSELYPPLLWEVGGAPEKLFVLGKSNLLTEKMVVVVGSRLVSNRGRMNARKVVKRLVNEGYVVVSGLARGVDTEVHRECLRLGGKTVAVLAHGLDWVYPQENIGLAKEILEKGGALVSQLEKGIRPEKYFFPLRNRLMVGMSLGVVVVEAGLRSGTMTTANWAGELGRQVWVVKGSVGTDLLSREGASEWVF